jgi:hypothetical protein
VAGVQNIQPLKELVAVTGDDFELRVLNCNQVKIPPKFSEKYTTIIKAVAEKHAEFYTYQPKEDRSFRTVLRGMDYSTDIRDIKSEIEKFGHTVVNIFNIKQTRTNIPLPLFFVDLKPNENNKDIYQIEILNYTKVKFEPPRPKRNISQCIKCQRNGHTQAYCCHRPRCVKCNALAVISPGNVQEKKNQTMSDVFSVTVTTQPTTRDAVSTKTYRREPSRRYEANKKKKTRKSYRKHTPYPTSLMLLLLNLNTINSSLLTRKLNTKQHTSSSYNCHQVTYKN